MKKALILIVLCLLCACGNKNITSASPVPSPTGVPAQPTAAAEDDGIEIPAALIGVWRTASFGYEYYGEEQPEFFVRFIDSQIQYGHTDNGTFVMEYADDIDSIQEIDDGIYRIQSKEHGGREYTYQTAGDDDSILEYYSTWNEREFADHYSASSSLLKGQ